MNKTNRMGKMNSPSVDKGAVSAEVDRVARLSTAALYELLDFANLVQRWSIRGRRRKGWRYGTFAQAAKHFGVPLERIADAVEAHYWLFTPDTGQPLADRRIDHEGE